MKTIADYPDALVEALATHEIFRKLGFTSDQIFFHHNPAPLHDVLIVVKHLGKQLSVTCGVLIDPNSHAVWTELCNAINSRQIPEDDFQCRYDNSYVNKNKISLLLMLRQKGIEPPLRSS